MDCALRKTFSATLTRAITVVAVVLAAPAAAWSARADSATGRVWLISTRCAPRCGRLDSAADRIGCWRLDADRQWVRADNDECLDGGGRSLPTTIFIHGNCLDRHEAICSAWPVYRRIKQDAGGRPFRFVIWSWPSDRICGRIRKDVRAKARYCDGQSYYLAQCLAGVDPSVPVSLVGYSFGARVITGALHLLAGGQVAGRSLPEQPKREKAPIRCAVLVAAALDADWLMPGHRNGLALSEVEHMLITQNGCDRVLKWYPRMYCRGGPQALGFAGPAGCEPAERVELLDVTRSVGRAHGWIAYLQAPGLRRRLARYTFVDSSEP